MSIPALVAAQNRVGGVLAGLAITAADAGPAPRVGFPLFDRRLSAPFDQPDLVVFHSTYIPAHARMAARLRRAGIPYLICARGGMTRYAQSFRRWKKRLANVLFFNRLVSGAAAIHCLTQGEADASRDWNRPMFVVGNGIDIPPGRDLAAASHGAARRLVFIGRLHLEYKGLDMLVEACKLVEAELRRTGSVVEIHGPDCGGSRNILGQRITRLGLQGVVQVLGPLVGQAKALVLRGADVFLHPSRSEGHPMAVLEALAYGVPCLLTPATNLSEEVVGAGAGWRVEATVAGIAEGLRQALGADHARLAQAGQNAHRMAAERYGWDRIAAESIDAYRRYAGQRHATFGSVAVHQRLWSAAIQHRFPAGPRAATPHGAPTSTSMAPRSWKRPESGAPSPHSQALDDEECQG